jgi:hypothetical protein
MKKEGVLVSLKAWSGDIEPYDSLDMVWVQVRGVPPKWSSWKCLRQIASSLGKMVEVDRSSLFSSFFSMVKVKITCKDPTRIPRKRLFEMDNFFYVIHFKVEKSLEMRKEDGDDEGKDEDNGDHEEYFGMGNFSMILNLKIREMVGVLVRINIKLIKARLVLVRALEVPQVLLARAVAIGRWLCGQACSNLKKRMLAWTTLNWAITHAPNF